jgi:CheY-like chemotaxis protein
VPALLRQLTDGRDQGLRLASQDMIRRIGRQAVSPLVEALPHVGDATVQRIVCDVLGDIGYPHAAPFLLELVMEPSTPSPVRDAARRALSRIGVPAETGLSNVYALLAQQYFDGHESLIAFPDQDSNNIWRYDQFIGLTPTTVPTPIFGHVMSMRMSVRAIEAHPGNADALSLFVAANLKREIDLPQGSVDPIFGDNQYSAAFYATVFGTATCMDVLAMALDRRDTALVRSAIDALAKTTGGSNLFASGQLPRMAGGGNVRERQPLLEAMFYPDRRVQYEAALTLARALPHQGFSGDYAVVPLLASAIRAGGRLFALVVADDPEDRQVLAKRMEDLGYEVVGREGSVAEVRNAIDHAVGIDVVALHMRSAQRAQQAVNDLRAVPKTSVVPVAILVDVVDVPGLRLQYRADSRVEVLRAGLPPQHFETGVDALLDRASGSRMTEFEAEEYAIAAVTALRSIAISGTPAFDAADAEAALLDALASRSGGMRLLVADVLAMIGTSRAQRGLFHAALGAEGVDQIDLFARVADSVKRHGNHAQSHHLAGLTDLVANSTGRTAEAAAEVHGALNLPTGTAVGLLPGRDDGLDHRGQRSASRR